MHIIREAVYTYLLPKRRAAEEGEIIRHSQEVLVGIIETGMSSSSTSSRTSATARANEGELCWRKEQIGISNHFSGE